MEFVDAEGLTGAIKLSHAQFDDSLFFLSHQNVTIDFSGLSSGGKDDNGPNPLNAVFLEDSTCADRLIIWMGMNGHQNKGFGHFQNPSDSLGPLTRCIIE